MFLLVIILAGCLFSSVNIFASDLENLDSADIAEYIEIPIQDTQKIFRNLIQSSMDEQIEMSDSFSFSPEKEAILLILQKSIQKNQIAFWSRYIPKKIAIETIKLGSQIVRLSMSDISVILKEVEKKSVEKATSYATTWLLEKEIKVATGILNVSYKSYLTGEIYKTSFQYILGYKGTDSSHGEVIIKFYSLETIEAPDPRSGYMWGGGIYKIKPFIATITGYVSKNVAQGTYSWDKSKEGPIIEISFPEEVPDLGIKPLTWVEKQKRALRNEIKKAVKIISIATGKMSPTLNVVWETSKEIKDTTKKLFDKIQSLIAQFNPLLPASIVEAPLFPNSLHKTAQEDNNQGEPNELGQKTEPEQQIEEEKPADTTEEQKLSLLELIDQLDDIAEKIDILSREVAKLIEEENAASIANKKGLAEAGSQENGEKEYIYYPSEPEEQYFSSLVVSGEENTSLPQILISEVVAGWNKANNEFVELYNPNDFEVVLNKYNFKLKLVNSSNKVTNKQLDWINSIISPKSYLLLADGTIELDGIVLVPDATFSNQLTKVSGVIITDGEDNIIDKTGWGQCLIGECDEIEKPAPSEAVEGEAIVLENGLQTDQSIERITDNAGNLVDTDNNSLDFILQTGPNPVNSKNESLCRQPEPEETTPLEETVPLEENNTSFEVSTTTLNFVAEELGENPLAQLFTVTNTGQIILEWNCIADSDWLTIQPASGTIEISSFAELEVSINISGLTAGNYKTTITVSNVGGEIKSLSVNIIVTAKATQYSPLSVVINEIAWMGTKASATDEWMELYNNTDQDISLSGWTLLSATDGQPTISLGEIIPAKGFYLLERTASTTISDIEEEQTYTGALNNGGEKLELRDDSGSLIDEIDCSNGWFSDYNEEKTTMERIDSTKSGSNADNWLDNNPMIAQQGLDQEGNLISGTPNATNSASLLEINNGFEDNPGQSSSTLPNVTSSESATTTEESNISFEISTTTLNFTAEESGENSLPRLFNITNTGQTELIWSASITYEETTTTSALDWLDIQPATGILATSSFMALEASINIADLKAGIYNATATIYITEEDSKLVSIKLTVTPQLLQYNPLSVVINEIAWMGTKASSADEWLELYNNTSSTIDLEGWTLKSSDESGPELIFPADLAITAQDYFLIEKMDDSATNLPADWFESFGNGLSNPNCEILSLYDPNNNLIDQTACLDNNWPAGKAAPDYISMERINSIESGDNTDNWLDNNPAIAQQGLDNEGNLILGTPNATNSASLLDKVVWVDDNFENDPENRRWKTIQEGIENANKGDIVLVDSGTYREGVTIDKQLTLRGISANTENPVIDAEAHVGTKNGINIRANGVNVEGFKIINARIGIHLSNSTNNTLKNNTFEQNNYYGISLEYSDFNNVANNTINLKQGWGRNPRYGIYLYHSHDNILQENTANNTVNNTGQNNSNGIYLENSDNNTLHDNEANYNAAGIKMIFSNNNILEKNTADYNMFGINMYASSNNTLKGNSMSDNCVANFTVEGVERLESDFGLDHNIDATNFVDGKSIYYLKNQSDVVIDASSNAGLVYCINCENIIIKDSVIDGRSSKGIYLYKTNNSTIDNVEISGSYTAITLKDSHSNTIKESIVSKNFEGIDLNQAMDNDIVNNIIKYNNTKGDGLQCMGHSPMYGVRLHNSSNNRISENLIVNNPEGIILSGSNSNTLSGNTIENNTKGISNRSLNNLFYHNNLINNISNEYGDCDPTALSKNQWYNSNLSQGNYCNNYDVPEEGCEDIDNNGFCDNPYSVNNDKFPFVQQDGWITP